MLFSRSPSRSSPAGCHCMERVARLIKNSRISQGIFTDDDLASAIWPAAVGKAVAAHTGRVKMVRTTLLVEVEDEIWRKQLYPLTSQILARIRKLTGSEVIQDIEFRVAVPRRQPQRAGAPDGGLGDGRSSADEADEIRDPVLRRVYKMSRKKATA